MGLVAFGQHRVGFWVVARGISARGELPEHVPVHVSGEPSDDRRALVVAAADEAGQVRWGAVLHDDGGSVLLLWDGLLFVALGRRALLLDEAGHPVAKRTFDEEVGTAWRVPGGLLLLGNGWATHVDQTLTPLWRRQFGEPSLHLLEASDGLLRLAAMGTDDWRELRLDPATGRDVAAPE
jgi:hypothetical protein